MCEERRFLLGGDLVAEDGRQQDREKATKKDDVIVDPFGTHQCSPVVGRGRLAGPTRDSLTDSLSSTFLALIFA